MAGFIILAAVAVGAVLLLAAKLQYPHVGRGGSPLDALSASVIAGLGALRVPVHLGGLTASALPLGALAAIGWAALWAIGRHDIPGRPLDERVRSGLKLGFLLGPACALLSLVFRIRGVTTVSADFWWSLLLGAAWGSLFGAIGAVRSLGSIRVIGRSAVEIFGGTGPRRKALGALGSILSVLVIGAVALILCGVIVALLSGRPRGDFGIGEALAGLIYLVAFGPNLVISVLALGFGSSISLGAQISSGGNQVGPLQVLSILDWPGGAPWWIFVTVLLTLGAGVWAGFRSYPRVERAGLLQAFAWASGLLALTLFFWASLAEARLGAGLLDRKGFARLAPNPWVLMASAALFSFVAETAGWHAAAKWKERGTP